MKSNEANYRCLSYTAEFACTDSTPRGRLIGIISLTSHHQQQHTNTITCNNAVRPLAHSNYPSSLQFPSLEHQQSLVFQIPCCFSSWQSPMPCRCLCTANDEPVPFLYCTPRFPCCLSHTRKPPSQTLAAPYAMARHPKHPELLDSIE